MKNKNPFGSHSDMWKNKMKGVPIAQIVTGHIPIPTFILKWGGNMPKEIKEQLEKGQAALLLDESGHPFSVVLMDSFGNFREKPVDMIREDNLKVRRDYI